MDSGIKFESDKISIEGIIPSFEYLIKNQRRIKGLIVTHGHEDHIGSIPHLLSEISIPNIYAGRIASGLI
jgi:ribonuclease J